MAALAGLGIAALQYAGQRIDLLAVGLAVVGLVALVPGLRPLLPPGTARGVPGLPSVVASRGLLAGAFFGMDALLPLTLPRCTATARPRRASRSPPGRSAGRPPPTCRAGSPTLPRERLLRAGSALLALGLAGTALAALPALGGWPAYPFGRWPDWAWGWACRASASCCWTSRRSTGAAPTPRRCRSPT